MPGWALKLFACLLTGLATVGAAEYVAGHLKNPAAPLQPTVVSAAGALGSSLHLGSGVQVSPEQQPLTFTSVS
jgi:hypothetical protein